ncbi:MAG: MoaD/ThiS family protein [Planctomycetales bacterium]|nr:MoaD/ThiS family protein [Planctomycetales bacterium]
MADSLPIDQCITIEFFGVVRHVAGVAGIQIALTQPSMTLRDLLQEVAQQRPSLIPNIVDSTGKLHTGYIANVNSDKFVDDVSTLVRCGDSVLLMSADAGG